MYINISGLIFWGWCINCFVFFFVLCPAHVLKKNPLSIVQHRRWVVESIECEGHQKADWCAGEESRGVHQNGSHWSKGSICFIYTIYIVFIYIYICVFCRLNMYVYIHVTFTWQTPLGYREDTFHLPTYLPTYLHTYIPTYLHTYIPTYLHTYISTNLHTYIPTYLHTYIPTYLHTYIPTYLHQSVLKWGPATMLLWRHVKT